MEQTPSQLGFRMPAEWEPHAATWIAWPHNRDDWPGKFAPIPWVYVEIVRLLSRSEPVHIVVRDGAMRRRASDRLDAAGVDLGKSQVLQGGDRPRLAPRLGADIRREGSTRPTTRMTRRPHRPDRVEVQRLGQVPELSRRPSPPSPAFEMAGTAAVGAPGGAGGRPVRVVMEGGAIDVNGRGTLLTTEECLLGEVQARNPGLGREEVERVLADYLGARHVIWLGRGIDGDDTHGHVDDLARFVGPRTVVTVVEPRADDPNHEPLQENLERLRAARDQDGQPLEVVELPMPRPLVFGKGDSACRPATRTSTSPTARSWSPPSTTRPTASPSTPSPASSRAARSSASTASTSSSASARSIACPSNNR